MTENLYSRRSFLNATAAAMIGGAAALTRDARSGEDPAKDEAPAEPIRPNIVLIMADDLGYGDLGCYGSKFVDTPNIDALAAGGVRFTDFHSSGAVCSPTRAGLLTGRYQQRSGITDVLTAANHRSEGLSPDELTFPKLLKEAGYRTALFGKWHLGYDEKFNPVKHGFDEFRGFLSGNIDYITHVDQTYEADWWDGTKKVNEKGYTTHLITQHSVQFIDANKDKPFLLFASYPAPHYPYQKPGDKPTRYLHEVRREMRRQPVDADEIYRAMIEEMDKGVGEIVAALKRNGLDRDTFVFFLSDNGATGVGSNGPLRGGKAMLWEGGHRVPAIACWPGRIPEKKETKELTTCLDLFPTLANLAGAKVPDSRTIDGVDLMPILTKNKSLGDRMLFWAHANQRAVRQGPWKLLVPTAGQKAAVSLYNLANDIGEKTDLIKAEPDRVQALQKALEDWEKEVTPPKKPDAKKTPTPIRFKPS